jgi:hypothetical protein
LDIFTAGMKHISIYSDTSSNRLKYTLELIFGGVLGVGHTITGDREKYIKENAIKINYSTRKLPSDVQIIPCGLLNEKDIRIQQIEVSTWNDLPVFFQTSSADIPFDLFSAVFYMVTRYEEYLPFIPDRHGRFKADQSLAFRENFLRIPIIDLWCIELAEKLHIVSRCPNIDAQKYQFQLTVDIDAPWNYKNKGFVFTVGSLLRDLTMLKFNQLAERWHVVTGKKPDPGDNYEYLDRIGERLKNPIIYFVLCRKRDTYDRNRSLNCLRFHTLLRHLDRNRTLGIHPSYASAGYAPFLTGELNFLENVLGRKIEKSRQHFLRLTLPITFRNLIDLGISEEHSMGFAAQTGFRAGIARPFAYYDLWQEKATSLMVIPFHVMDRTLLTYLNHTPEKAITEFEHYTRIIKSVGGTFVCLWHNDSMSDHGEWKGWKRVFERMIELNEGK